jgi:hypothetical protein
MTDSPPFSWFGALYNLNDARTGVGLKRRSLGTKVKRTIRNMLENLPGVQTLLACTIVICAHIVLGDGFVAIASQAPTDASEPATVLLTEYALGPNDVVVAAGEIRLRLVNAGIRRHTLTVLVHGEELSSPEVRAGDAAEWLLHIDQPGRYELWCNEYRHLEKGMGGRARRQVTPSRSEL